MVKPYIQIGILLAFAWNIYSRCQHEVLLPMIAGTILILSFLFRLGTTGTQFKLFERMPLFAIILLSLGLGYFYRSAFPLPEEAISPFPEATATAQSATIIATICLWLKPFSRSNFYLILFMAWLTVTLSINVPYSRELFLNFSVFCLVSIVVVILNTSNRPDKRQYLVRYYRNFAFFSTLLVALTIVLFFGVSRGVMAFDQAFMNIMKDYILPRHYTHFLNIDSQLSLINPGVSAFDKRPVLEVSFPKVKAVYLKTQIFRDFDHGVWKEPDDLTFTPVAGRLDERDPKIILTMFTLLKEIVPSPSGVTGVAGQGTYEKDSNEIVYSKEQRPSRILTFSADPGLIPIRLTEDEFRTYTAVPDDMATDLKALSAKIVGDATDPIRKTLRIRNFFNRNFEYSLEVDFRADNQGLIAMIKEKRPAYCTYFATAMTLLLRAEGIPSRMATGFFTGEVIDARQNRFLARVRHAHAWVEVLLPFQDTAANREIMAWGSFDPTPPSAIVGGPGDKTFLDFERFAERTWLSLLRFTAHMQNIDKEKFKKNVFLGLMLFMLLMNVKAILRAIKRLLAQKRDKPKTIQAPPHLQTIYRRYEQYLKKYFNETRALTETDHDVVIRLRTRPDVAPESLRKVESFLKHYHAARFGEKDEELEI